MVDSNEFIPPRSIKIENYYYSFKDTLVKDISYRCKHRRKCHVVIKISKEELKSYLEDNRYKIKYSITSTQKSHICDNEEKDKNNKIINTEEEMKGLKRQEFIKSLTLWVWLMDSPLQ